MCFFKRCRLCVDGEVKNFGGGECVSTLQNRNKPTLLYRFLANACWKRFELKIFHTLMWFNGISTRTTGIEEHNRLGVDVSMSSYFSGWASATFVLGAGWSAFFCQCFILSQILVPAVRSVKILRGCDWWRKTFFCGPEHFLTAFEHILMGQQRDE